MVHLSWRYTQLCWHHQPELKTCHFHIFPQVNTRFINKKHEALRSSRTLHQMALGSFAVDTSETNSSDDFPKSSAAAAATITAWRLMSNSLIDFSSTHNRQVHNPVLLHGKWFVTIGTRLPTHACLSWCVRWGLPLALQELTCGTDNVQQCQPAFLIKTFLSEHSKNLGSDSTGLLFTTKTICLVNAEPEWALNFRKKESFQICQVFHGLPGHCDLRQSALGTWKNTINWQHLTG